MPQRLFKTSRFNAVTKMLKPVNGKTQIPIRTLASLGNFLAVVQAVIFCNVEQAEDLPV
jgi:hypothetical protein